MGFCTIDNLSIVAVKAATIGSKEYAPLSVSERLLNRFYFILFYFFPSKLKVF